MTERQALAYALAESRKASQHQHSKQPSEKSDALKGSRQSGGGESSSRSRQGLSTSTTHAHRGSSSEAAHQLQPALRCLTTSDTESFAEAREHSQRNAGSIVRVPSSLSPRKRTLECEDDNVSSSSQSFRRVKRDASESRRQGAQCEHDKEAAWSDTSAKSHITSSPPMALLEVHPAFYFGL